MAQRIFNLSKWTYVGGGSGYVRFDNPKRRIVTLEVNSDGISSLYVTQDVPQVDESERDVDSEAGRLPTPEAPQRQFLAKVDGRDTIEFGVDGPFSLEVEGEGECYVYSIDGQETFTRIEVPEIFTRVANRKQRNPNLEMIEFTMKQNQLRFMAQMQAELAAREIQIEERMATFAKQRDQRAPIERTLAAVSSASGRATDAGPSADAGVSAEEESGDGKPVPAKRAKVAKSADSE